MSKLAGLVHPMLDAYFDEIAPAPRELKEGKTDFQKWCRGIRPKQWVAKRPAAPKGDFTPRRERRKRIVGSVKQWPMAWFLTRGYDALVQDLGEQLKAYREAQEAKAKGAAE